ncbi:MAG TPA: 2-C-methyl-D-erythritol 2,4-cyclodiphosphate synthase [Deltaproteobacteria bacterium]|nr:2-C-methyl-D-erythritol 2,4-cyclodiphosphate synthase [Deltaproteobacteria bacterium]
MPFRIGIGFDIHRLVPGRPLVIGGVDVPFEKGLLGHSDGDVVIHAVCDAILGALARGDIGVLYPDTSAETEGMNSLAMLKGLLETVVPDYEIVNIDINCICEKPRLSGYRQDMVASVAGAAGIDPSAVSVKFRTHEGLGEIGAGDAIAAQAVVLVKKRQSSLGSVIGVGVDFIACPRLTRHG